MDMSVSGSTTGADAVSASNSGRAGSRAGDAPQGGGFLEALANAKGGESESQGGSADAAPGGGSQGGTPAGSVKGGPGSSHHAKPLIDIGNTAIATDPAAEGDMPRGSAADAEAALDDVRPKKPLPHAATAAESIKDATGQKDLPHIAKTTGTQKDAKDKVEKDSADDSLSDVLTLLKGGDGTDRAIPAQTIAGAAHGHGQELGPRRTQDDLTASGALANVDQQATEAVPGAETSDAGRTFRLSRADGRGKSMDMTINPGKDGVETETRSAQGGDVENVSVLEPRRFIGLAQGSNSAAVAAAMTGDSEWASSMQPGSALSNAAAWTSTGKVVNMLKIQMHPIDLGLVTATMRLKGDELSVDLKVETPAAYRQLREDHTKIVEALRAQGYAVDNITVSIAPTDRSDAGAQSNFQGQSSQQQSSANQGQGSEPQARGEGRAEQRTSDNDGLRNANGGGAEERIPGLAGRGGSGDVYL